MGKQQKKKDDEKINKQTDVSKIPKTVNRFFFLFLFVQVTVNWKKKTKYTEETTWAVAPTCSSTLNLLRSFGNSAATNCLNTCFCYIRHDI